MTTTTEDNAPILYLPNGKIKIYMRDIEDKEREYVLRMPRFKEFKAIKATLFEANAAITDKAKSEGLTGVDATDPVALAEYATLTEKLLDETYEQLSVVMSFIFETLADNQLPTDYEDWPAWLLADQEPITKMLTHWKTVPLVRG